MNAARVLVFGSECVPRLWLVPGGVASEIMAAKKAKAKSGLRGVKLSGEKLRREVLRQCAEKFADGLGREIADARGQSISEAWDDWWKCQLLGLLRPDSTEMWIGRQRTDNIRLKLVFSLDNFNVLNLPTRLDDNGRECDRFLSRHEMAVLSLLCGSYPNVADDEKLTVSAVIAREEKLIEKLSVRHGPGKMELLDPGKAGENKVVGELRPMRGPQKG